MYVFLKSYKSLSDIWDSYTPQEKEFAIIYPTNYFENFCAKETEGQYNFENDEVSLPPVSV